MIKVENVETWGFEHAIRGCRNPMNSWDKSDSHWCIGHKFEDCKSTAEKCIRKDDNFDNDVYCVGKADLDLMRRLYNASLQGDNHAHRKYLRQIFVSMDITAPLYFWKEADTYKVGTVANSCSTMNTLHKRPLTLDDFSHERLDTAGTATLNSVIERINLCRKYYIGEYDNVMDVLEDGMTKKDYWYAMIQLLPTSYNQKRTVTMNYENIMTIINQRSGHKLDEWKTLCDILRTLPYIKEIRGEADELCE